MDEELSTKRNGNIINGFFRGIYYEIIIETENKYIISINQTYQCVLLGSFTDLEIYNIIVFHINSRL